MVRHTRHESDNQVLIPNLEHSKAIIRLQCTLSSCKRFLVLLHRCPLPSNMQEISATVATYSHFTTMSFSRTSFTPFEASSTRSCSGVWTEATLHPSNVHLPCPPQIQDAHSPASKIYPLILNTQSNHYNTLLCVLSTATTPLPRARQACRQDQFLRYYLVTLHAFNKLSRTSSLQPSKPVKLVSCSRKRDTTLRPF